MSKMAQKSKSLKKIFIFLSFLLASIFNSTLAYAQACSAGSSLGGVICTLLAGSSQIPTLLAALSYLFGLFLVTMAIIKVKEHVENPNQVPMSEPVKRFIAGGGFLALPIVTEAAKSAVDTGGMLFNSGTSGNVSGGGLDALLFNLVTDIFQPMMFLISGFGYLAGIILIMIGISRMLKSAQDGPKGPGGLGTIFTFLVAGLLFSLDSIMDAATGTFFGGGVVMSSANLLSSTGDPAVDNHILAVISSIVGFMMIVGLIAFTRGIFILREVAEGSGQASLMAAMSHIIGGALAVNIGGISNAVQSTFGINLVGFS